MDDGINTQLRTITFSEARRGFDKNEVREFLDRGRRLDRGRWRRRRAAAPRADRAEIGQHPRRRRGRGRGPAARSRAGGPGAADSAKAEADAYRIDAEAEAREHLREARAEAVTDSRGRQPIRLRHPDQSRRVLRTDPPRGQAGDRRAARGDDRGGATDVLQRRAAGRSRSSPKPTVSAKTSRP